MLGFIPFPQWLKPEIIPGFPYLRWYGLMYLVAFGITYLLFKVQVKEKDIRIKTDDVFNIFFWGILGLLIGARLFAVIVYDSSGYFRRYPLQAILPFNWTGGQCTYTGLAGMSYHGGLIGAVVGVFIYCRVKRFSLLEVSDLILAATPLGYTFGRLGNFINGELYGRVSAAPWAMVFPDAEKVRTDLPWVQDFTAKAGIDVSGQEWVNLPRHPSQLYEAFFEGIVLWLILWFLLRKRSPFRGFIMGCYIIGYGVFRFFIEYARQPDIGIDFPLKFVKIDNPGYLYLTPWNFTTGQILCFLMILAGGIFLLTCGLVNKAKKEKKELEESKKESKKRMRRRKKYDR